MSPEQELTSSLGPVAHDPYGAHRLEGSHNARDRRGEPSGTWENPYDDGRVYYYDRYTVSPRGDHVRESTHDRPEYSREDRRSDKRDKYGRSGIYTGHHAHVSDDVESD